MTDVDVKVLRWEVPVDDQWHNVGSGPIAMIASRDDPGALVEVWTIQPTHEHADRLVRAFGTGQPVPPDTIYLGSTLAGPGRALAWHVFEQYQE